jgi:hypothetical protein
MTGKGELFSCKWSLTGWWATGFVAMVVRRFLFWHLSRCVVSFLPAVKFPLAVNDPDRTPLLGTRSWWLKIGCETLASRLPHGA